MLKSFSFCLGFTILLYSTIIGQEQLGIRLENYSGINSIFLNPAGYATSPYNWDINLVEASQFIQNNYVYLENSSLLSLLGGDEPYVYGPINRLRDVPREGLVLDYYEDGKSRYGFANTSIVGPSFFVRLNENHAFGLFSRARLSASVTGIPTQLSYYQFNSDVGRNGFTIKKGLANLMSWSEFGINYTYKKETADGILAIGVHLKSLNGYESAYVFNTEPLEIAKTGIDSVKSSAGAIEYGFTNTLFQMDNEEYQLQKNGSGIGIDLGIVFTSGYSEFDDYKWRFGISLLDIGKITFNRNAELHELSTDKDVFFGGTHYEQYNEIEEWGTALKNFSYQISGDSLGSFRENKFSNWLPTALSFQADYNISRGVYVNATALQSVPFARNAINRSSLFALTPRYESKWFSLSLPISLYNYNIFRTGLAMRLGFLYFGSDDIGSILSRYDFSGTDFYVGIKLFPFFSLNGGNGSRTNKNGDIRCYQF